MDATNFKELFGPEFWKFTEKFMESLKIEMPEEIYTERLTLIRVSNSVEKQMWEVFLKGENEHVGWFTLDMDAEVTYKISPKFRKKGFCTEALVAMIEICPRHIAVRPVNLASLRVTEKAKEKTSKPFSVI